MPKYSLRLIYIHLLAAYQDYQMSRQYQGIKRQLLEEDARNHLQVAQGNLRYSLHYLSYKISKRIGVTR